MIRVCVADDHELVRRGIRQMLSESPDIRVADEVATGEELVLLAQKRRWDAVLLDLSMPGQGGLETLRRLKAQFPRLPVLILTMHSEDQYAVRAIKLGASGYLTKDSASKRLAEAVRVVAGGKRYITPRLAEQLAATVAQARPRPHEGLSTREYQVFSMLVRGRSVTQIAGELGLSVKTVSTNRSRLLRKLGLSNNAELVHYAIKHGLAGELGGA
jgi:DNA-binding NarL/FixJ family response regulator